MLLLLLLLPRRAARRCLSCGSCGEEEMGAEHELEGARVCGIELRLFLALLRRIICVKQS